MAHRLTARPFVGATALALLAFSAIGDLACTCDSDENGSAPDGEAQRQTAWLQACVRSPHQLLNETRRLVRSEQGLRLPSNVDRVVSELLSIPMDQLENSVNWSSPVLVVIYEQRAKRGLSDSLALRARRAVNNQGLPIGASEVRREIETSRGTLHLAADSENLYISPTEWGLEAIRAEPVDSAVCAAVTGQATADAQRSDLVIDMTPELLGSQPMRAWVERRGAWLETSARQATARKGRPTLGDPEVVARMLARWGSERREQAEAAAPLRLTLSVTAEVLHLELAGRDSSIPPTAEASADGIEGQLRLIAPDAYFTRATRATGAERREVAAELVGGLARIAGDRLPEAERIELEAAFTRLAAATDGWVTLALRPALEPGPLVGLAALECSDTAEAAAALTAAAELFGRGYLQNVLEHLGARVEIAASSDEDELGDQSEQGTVTFQVALPSDTTEERGAVARRLTGSAPALVWRRQGNRLLVAFGPEPQPELVRLTEAARGDTTASVLTQPVVASLVEGRPQAAAYTFGWVSAVMGLITHGGPGSRGLPPGGLALATGRSGGGDGPESDNGSWRVTLRMDSEQARVVFPWLVEGNSR